MPAILATGPYAILHKVGVPTATVEQLKQYHVKLSVGFHNVQFLSAANDILADTGKLSISTSDIMKGVSPAMKAVLHSQIMHTLDLVFNYIGVPMILATGVNTVKSPVTAAAPESLADNELIATPIYSPALFGATVPPSDMTVNPVVKVSPGVLSNSVITLRDATALYQRVKGTSIGSVYVVVAIKTPSLKIAAKIVGDKLSVRAESPTDVSAFMAQLLAHGFNLNTGYASGHYDCGGAGVTPEKTLGAILIGCGIEFDTPLPNIKKVRELCK